MCKRAIVQERDYGSLLQRFADAMLNNDTASPHRLSNLRGSSVAKGGSTQSALISNFRESDLVRF